MSRLFYSLGVIVFAWVIWVGMFMHPPREPNRQRQHLGYIRIHNLVKALASFQADCGRYPSAAEGLEALADNPSTQGWRGPYVESQELTDPWGRAFHYQADGQHPEVISYGADGKSGGDFFDMVLSSRTLWLPSPQSPSEIKTQWRMFAVWTGAWAGFFACFYGLLRS